MSVVLHNGDLDSALKDAQSYATAFSGCAQGLPPYDSSSPEASTEYYKAFAGCAIKVDSRLSAMFSSIQ